MLKLNDLQFAKNNSEFTSTLFEGDRTAHGYYRVLKNGIKLMTMQKEPIAFICTNENTPFIVTCFKFEGRTRYMNALTSEHDKLLGFTGLSYSEGVEATKQAINSIGA